MWVLIGPNDSEEPNMQAITTIGLDIAKSVFQVAETMSAAEFWEQSTG
jgi:hypothetical protein